VRSLRSHFKLAVILLISSGALACTCAAYDVDVGHMWGTLLLAVGFGKKDAAAKVTVVTAGNELNVDGPRVTLRRVPAVELSQRLAWAGINLQDGWLSFQGQTLENVIAEFNKHNARQIVINDPATRQLQVGGEFRVTDVDGFLAALAITHGVRAVASPPQSRGPQVIVLSGGGSGSGRPGSGSSE
jgi:hypothetical protein